MEAKHLKKNHLIILVAGAVASNGAAANAIDDSDDCDGTGIEKGKIPPFLADVVQSLSCTAGPVLGTIQNVAFLNSNPQYDGGLQHPDCK
ncbi:hypothetical protein SDJN02_24864, partial [Cucurbita argyrosperma subsp. argyrosperma]